MSLKKFLKSHQHGQSAIEFILTAAISIIALLGMAFVIQAKNSAFEQHFNMARFYITGSL